MTTSYVSFLFLGFWEFAEPLLFLMDCINCSKINKRVHYPRDGFVIMCTVRWGYSGRHKGAGVARLLFFSSL